MSDSLTTTQVEPNQCPSHQSILLSTNPRTNLWKFHEKILRIGWAGKWGFFEAAILNFLSRPFWIFFCFISVKNPAHLYEVSFFSALWMVFPESWKRRAADFYAHDCNTKVIYFFYQNVGSSRCRIPNFYIWKCICMIIRKLHLVATNQDVLLFKLLNFLGVLQTKTCY